MFGPEGFEVGLEEAEQNIDRVGRIGNVKAMLVVGLVGKSEAKSELLRDEIERGEMQSELLEKTPQDKKERLGRFDLVIEFDFFAKDFGWPNESEKPGGPAGRLGPEPDRGRAEAHAEWIGLEGGEIAEGVDAPFMEDGEKWENSLARSAARRRVLMDGRLGTQRK